MRRTSCGVRNPFFSLKVPPNYRDPSLRIAVFSLCDYAPESPMHWLPESKFAPVLLDAAGRLNAENPLLFVVLRGLVAPGRTGKPIAQGTDTAWRGPELSLSRESLSKLQACRLERSGPRRDQRLRRPPLRGPKRALRVVRLCSLRLARAGTQSGGRSPGRWSCKRPS